MGISSPVHPPTMPGTLQPLFVGRHHPGLRASWCTLWHAGLIMYTGWVARMSLLAGSPQVPAFGSQKGQKGTILAIIDRKWKLEGAIIGGLRGL